MVADIGTKALASVRLKELKGRLGLIEEEVEEAGDLQEAKKGAENCHMEKPQLMDQAQAERLVKVLMVMALVQRAKGAEEEEEDHRALECAMLLYTIVVVVATVVSQALWKWWGRGHHPSNAQADSSATTEEMEEEALLPALQRRASQAAHLASIVGSTTSGGVTGHRAGTNEPSTVSSATSQIPAPAQRGCSRNTDRTPEVTTSGQATPSEEPQASQQKNSGASRHQQVSTSDTASADKKISSQSPGETSSGNITMTPAGSTSTVSIAAKPPTSTNKHQQATDVTSIQHYKPASIQLPGRPLECPFQFRKPEHSSSTNSRWVG